MKYVPFHLSLPCKSITETRRFYIELLGCEEGRSTSGWIDIDLFGNQITFTKSGSYKFDFKSYKFGDAVLPSFHFGVIVENNIRKEIYENLKGSKFDIIPEFNFLKGQSGEHTSFFVTDPNGHTVEFKSFLQPGEIFNQ